MGPMNLITTRRRLPRNQAFPGAKLVIHCAAELPPPKGEEDILKTESRRCSSDYILRRVFTSKPL
ncbi:unnamed protein product [Blumeria hordei]|uniref:Uncharacterized protein n=1 Tax=Blumeria hordei TaxID=2867405 RepID=A0A383UKX6_BLUHO|nr:unnamed protein product [Blumeria hordei]